MNASVKNPAQDVTLGRGVKLNAFKDVLHDVHVTWVLSDVFHRTRLERFEFLKSLVGESESTPFAHVSIALVFESTPRTFKRRELIGFVLGDIDSVQASELTLGLLGEHGHVVRRGVGSADPPEAILKVRLAHALRREVRGTGTPEVGESDGLRDAGVLRELPKRLSVHVVGDRLRGVELAPERCVVGVSRVLGEPAVEVRDARDESNRAFSCLSIDADSETVLVIRDIAESEIAELARAGTGVPSDSDHRLVACVVGDVDHVLDLLPRDHVGGVGCGVVIALGRGDPGDSVGDVIALGDALAEDSEGVAEVGVSVRVLVVRVDPAHNVLGGFAVFDGFGDIGVTVSCHERDMFEEFDVALVRVLLAEEFETVRELNDSLAFGVGNFGMLADEFALGFDLSRRVLCHRAKEKMMDRNVNVRFNARPAQNPFCSIPAGSSSQVCGSKTNSRRATAVL